MFRHFMHPRIIPILITDIDLSMTDILGKGKQAVEVSEFVVPQPGLKGSDCSLVLVECYFVI